MKADQRVKPLFNFNTNIYNLKIIIINLFAFLFLSIVGSDQWFSSQ